MNTVVFPQDDLTLSALHKLLSSRELPDFVKSASLEELTNANLTNNAYADTVNKKLLIHTKAATWAADRWLEDNKEQLDPQHYARMRRRVTKAAEYLQVDLAHKQEPKPTRTALGDKYPLDTPTQIKQAAAYLDQWHKEFEPADRKKFANNVLTAAYDLGVSLDDNTADYLERQAGLAMGRTIDFSKEIIKRAEYWRRTETKIATDLEALANTIVKRAEYTNRLPDGLTEQVLGYLESLDKMDGGNWNRPEECLTVTRSKAAAYMDSVIKDSHGNWWLKKDIANLPNWAFSREGDKEAGTFLLTPQTKIDKFSKGNSDELIVWGRLLSDAGVKPVGSDPKPNVNWSVFNNEARA